jgi:hypothetical protein
MAKAGARDRINRKAAERLRVVKEWLDAYKLARGCADCGYAGHPAGLDFDHVTGVKKSNLSRVKSLGAAMEEAKKCEVVCSNCHRVRTAVRTGVRFK